MISSLSGTNTEADGKSVYFSGHGGDVGVNGAPSISQSHPVGAIRFY